MSDNPMQDVPEETYILWFAGGDVRYLVPADAEIPPGALQIVSLDGEERMADPDWIQQHCMDQAMILRWAEDALSDRLSQLRTGLDESLAVMRARLDADRHRPISPASGLTPDAVPAILSLVIKLPGVIVNALSGDIARQAEANGAMADLQWQLNAAGVPVDARFGRFPERLAALRADVPRPEPEGP